MVVVRADEDPPIDVAGELRDEVRRAGAFDGLLHGIETAALECVANEGARAAAAGRTWSAAGAFARAKLADERFHRASERNHERCEVTDRAYGCAVDANPGDR